MSYSIKDIYIMYEKEPMGVDWENPYFSWKFSSADKDLMQSSVRIQVGTEEGSGNTWDSGVMLNDCSSGIRYAGDKLQPCTKYYITIETTNTRQECAIASTCFETGFLNPGKESWNEAKWIGAPEYYVSSDTMGVFVIESEITIKNGNRAGLVFGANDERLLNKERNEYLIEGENFIRYEINIGNSPPTIDIYRVGYHPEDRSDKPFATVPIRDIRKKEFVPVITEKNLNEPHVLRVEVTGNCAYAYIDDILVDAEIIDGGQFKPRQLNPLGDNDTTCYPRMCEVGYFVSKIAHASFNGIRLRHYRQPSNVFRELDMEQGVEFFSQKEDVQHVQDPSVHSLPMVRNDFFLLDKSINKVRLYVTSRGIYECMINGEKISNDYFPPGASQFDKHLMYQTYDITDFVKEGKNGIGFLLAPGWWSDGVYLILGGIFNQGIG